MPAAREKRNAGSTRVSLSLSEDRLKSKLIVGFMTRGTVLIGSAVAINEAGEIGGVWSKPLATSVRTSSTLASSNGSSPEFRGCLKSSGWCVADIELGVGLW